MKRYSILFVLSPIIMFSVSAISQAQSADIDPAEFQKVIRATEPLTPLQEQLGFKLPPGFEIQLVAAEPDIAKPMNMAFDARGRLWVASTLEYPIPAEEGAEPRDTIKILEDTNGDGRADVVKTFATGLNIPLGIMPYKDGVVCFGIPNIWFLRDTDGDDKADTKEILYGPLGYDRDTHGMCNSFTRGFDGWLYATHGFNNHTDLSGTDGNKIHMESGNTFRMRWDGSRVEHYSHGLVNPFGMTFDGSGDLYVADCHTKPISLIFQEGYYQSFGKPHDGLGYVPNVMEHLHNSTAIAGIAISEQGAFPQEFHRNTFGGNVMTSRINRDTLQQIGSSIQAIEKPDFLISSDPWFRPVDLKFGPDGALYVADFYNRIIGHYEVKLDHPGRDRHRGRIWKIVYNDPNKQQASPAPSTDFTVMSMPELFEEFASTNRIRRMMAADWLVDHFGLKAVKLAHSTLRSSNQPTVQLHTLWVLNRLNSLSFEELTAATRDSQAMVRIHAFRVLTEYKTDKNDPVAKLLATGINDADPNVRRAAIQASAVHPQEANISQLMELFHSTDEKDIHLKHVILISLRNHLRNEQWFQKTVASLSRSDMTLIAQICLSLKNEAAGQFIVKNLSVLDEQQPEKMTEYITFASQYVSSDAVDVLVQAIRTRYQDNREFQRVQMYSVRDGLAKRNQGIPESVNQWAAELAGILLENAKGPQPLGWSFIPSQAAPSQANPWKLTTRRTSSDGKKNTPLWSSLPGGERAVGTYRSDSFILQKNFSFFLAGHDGFPDKKQRDLNFVRIRDAKKHQILNAQIPLRHDVANKFSWDTGDKAGSEVVVELVDENSDAAFAWIAAGRFSEQRLNPSQVTIQLRKAIDIINRFQLKDFQTALSERLVSGTLDRQTSANAAIAIVSMNPESRLLGLAESLNGTGLTADLRSQIITAITKHDSATSNELVTKVMQVASFKEQAAIANQLVTGKTGLLLLIELLNTGKASARLLVQPAFAEKVASLVNESQKSQLEEIVASLPPGDERLLKPIVSRRQSYDRSGGDAQIGKLVYEKNCAVCHQVAGKGKQVGPNLDGIGNRGLDRLCEDLLTPNRNVDVAFRSSTIITDEGKVFVGLVKNSEGEQWTLVNNKGEVIQIARDSIDEQKKSTLSPMPANLVEELNDEQFRNLMAYLLSTAKSH
ncbi:MAG: c-type cytochrome [Planctomycetaceae bacterium]|nr:c-type cytochrome [Planctomycetaceae bacterium]